MMDKKRVTTSVNIDRMMLYHVDRIAEDLHLSRSSTINMIISRYLNSDMQASRERD